MDAIGKEGNRPLGRKRCLWWVSRVLASLVALLVIALLCGALYQSFASASDRRNYPPLGDLVDVGGHRLHIYCLGAGSPTVVLEAGLGDSSLHWSPVLDKIARCVALNIDGEERHPYPIASKTLSPENRLDKVMKS